MYTQAGGFKVLSQCEGQNQGTRVQRSKGQTEAANEKQRPGPGFWQAGTEMSLFVFFLFCFFGLSEEFRVEMSVQKPN